MSKVNWSVMENLKKEMETWFNKAQQTMNLGMLLQDRWYPKQICALQTQMTPFI